MKQKPKPRPLSGNDNDMYAVGISAIVTIACAGATAWLLQYTIQSFQDSNTMALLITDAGVKSDDKNLEHQLSTATLAMKATRDIAMAMAFGSTAILTAIIYRIYKRS